MIVNIPTEQSKFIENHAAIINIKTGGLIETWYHMPFYLKKVGENQFEIVSFEYLPQHVIDFNKSARGEPHTSE